jgi:hypothetical protein
MVQVRRRDIERPGTLSAAGNAVGANFEPRPRWNITASCAVVTLLAVGFPARLMGGGTSMDRTSIAGRVGRSLMGSRSLFRPPLWLHPERLMRNTAMVRLLHSVSSGARWPGPPLRLQRRQSTIQRHRLITIRVRRRFTQLRLRRSISTHRPLLCIMLRCRTTGRGFTTATTEDGHPRSGTFSCRRWPGDSLTRQAG